MNNYRKGNRKNKVDILSGVLIISLIVLFSSCSIAHQIHKQANTVLLRDSIIKTGHIGISIYEPAENKFWFQLAGNKYFIPASNTKLFTAYAAMKFLGDSLLGLKYQLSDSAINIYPTGDPSFLHPDFIAQPVLKFLQRQHHIIYHNNGFSTALGMGWAWDDYLESYMVQRAALPIYGNLIRVYNNNGAVRIIPKTVPYAYAKINTNTFIDATHFAERSWDKNELLFAATDKDSLKDIYEIPMVANWQQMIGYLEDTLHQKIKVLDKIADYSNKFLDATLKNLYTQPTDSLLKPMLFNSDNFFAEQCLLMISNQHLGYMSTHAIIDALLKTELNSLPQKPRWVDGSGLSRYNLFTPASFVFVLNKMINEFGTERLKRILPTGGEGTLKNYFQQDAHFIFAKTGSLSNNTAISGLLYTKKGKLLLFSVLVNQFMGSASHVRHAVEKFLEGIRERY